MEKLNRTVTRLSDDMRQIFMNAFCDNADMTRLCRDHHDPLLHGDNKPVLSITQDEFVGIFNTNTNRFLLTAGQALRLGTYCHLPFPNLLAFTLKAEWEVFLSAMRHISSESGSEETDHTDKYISSFKPDPGRIFGLLKDIVDVSSSSISYCTVDFYLSDLLQKSDFLLSNDQISNLYTSEDISEEILLHNVSPQLKESYYRFKELWLTKSTELDDMLMYLERKKRLNLGLENKYFRIFGNLESDKSKFLLRLDKYKIIIEMIRENPELSLRDMIRYANDKLINAKREQNEIRNKIVRSLNHIDFEIGENSNLTVSEDFKSSYMQECKKMLKKLFFLLHTDTCPNYRNLSGQQKTEINKLWLKLMKSTKEDMYSFSPAMLLYSLPDYEQLKSIYEKACGILGINPEYYETGNRLEFMIKKGSSIESVIGFLKGETDGLELHLARLELIQNEYTHEDQTNIYRRAMEDINGHTETLKKEISGLKMQIKMVKGEISEELIKAAG
jgi:hypothetical protein